MDNAFTRSKIVPLSVAATLLAFLASIASQPLHAQLRGRDLKKGGEFLAVLTQRRGVEWKGLPLHVATEQLSADLKLAIFLDRRVDPTTPIDVSADNGPVYQILDQMAESAKLDVAVIESVVYLAPAGTGNEIGARGHRMAQQRLPAVWRTSRPLDWPRLSSPKEQLEGLLRGRRLRVVNSAEIPHDVWRATHLPAIPLSVQTQILLAGFELEVSVSRNVASLRAVSSVEPIYSQKHNVPKFFDWDEKKLGEILGENGRLAKTRAKGASGASSAELLGTSWQHAKLAAVLRTPPENAAAPVGTVQYSVPKTRAPLNNIIQQLAKRLMLEVQLSEKIEPKALNQIVESFR
jgi:hypothetical protein